MAKRRKTPVDYIRDRLKILESADRLFKRAIESTEKSLYSAISRLLGRADTEGGHFIQSEANDAVLTAANREIKEIIRRSDLPKRVDSFLTTFTRIEKSNDGLFKDLIGESFRLPDSRVYRKQLSDFIVTQLADVNIVHANIGQPIAKMVFEAVNQGQPVRSAEKRIRDYIAGTGQGGVLAKHAGQIARDTVLAYDGFIQDSIQKRYKLDGFFYLGSLIKTSRQNCVDMINGSGVMKDFAIRPGLYRTADLQKIINAGRGRSGFNPAVTPQNFATIRFGWNCRHAVTYTRLTYAEKNEQIVDAFADQEVIV